MSAPGHGDGSGGAPVRSLLDDAVAKLGIAGIEDPRLDAEILLAEAAGVSRTTLIAGLVEVDDAVAGRFRQLIARRAAREPLAYIVGRKEFYSLDLEVGPAVLIPRPETEVLIDAALEFLAEVPHARVLDIGTGSGAIALAVAANAPHAQVVATDVSVDALEIARRNAARYGLTARVEFRRANCFEPADGGRLLGSFDLVVSNPPYIPRGEVGRLQPEVERYEPSIALFGGDDGLEFHRAIAASGPGHLNPGGLILVEVADGQSAAASLIYRNAGLGDLAVLNDLAGRPRVIRARRAA